MPRFLAPLLSVCCAVAAPEAARAGAYLLDPGYGQFIAGVGLSEGSRRFDTRGRPRPAPAYRKAVASGYLEYGWRSWLTVVAAPALARDNGVAANQVTGSDGSAFGARVLLARRGDAVVSLQALAQPPLGGDRAAALATGGSRAAALDIRLLAARTMVVGRWPVFVELAPGVRLRAAPFPDEARLDLAAGLRPTPRVLLLGQVFASTAPERGPVARTSYAKLQGSVVVDLSPRWSLQLGAVRTIAGRNAARETGPLIAVWSRF